VEGREEGVRGRTVARVRRGDQRRDRWLHGGSGFTRFSGSASEYHRRGLSSFFVRFRFPHSESKEGAMRRPRRRIRIAAAVLAGAALLAGPPRAQLIDRTQAPNAANDGIAKSLTDEIGAGRGDGNTPASASFLINRDPYRAIRRGREIFQRKFTRLENQGPGVQDGVGDINT